MLNSDELTSVRLSVKEKVAWGSLWLTAETDTSRQSLSLRTTSKSFLFSLGEVTYRLVTHNLLYNAPIINIGHVTSCTHWACMGKFLHNTWKLCIRNRNVWEWDYLPVYPLTAGSPYKTAQCIARIGVNDMCDLCGQRKTTRYWTTFNTDGRLPWWTFCLLEQLHLYSNPFEKFGLRRRERWGL